MGGCFFFFRCPFGGSGEIVLIPGDGFLEPLEQRGFWLPPQEAVCFGTIYSSAGLSCGLTGVPSDLTVESHEVGNGDGELADGDFFPGAQVERLGFVIEGCSEEDGFRRVPDEEEFSRGASISPEGNVRDSLFLCLHEFANHCGDHVAGLGVEVITGSIEVDGYKVDAIEVVLLAIGLQLDEEHFLCQAIGGIRFFGIAVP